MKMRTWGVLLAGLVPAVAWLCTGGVVVHRYWLLPFNSLDQEFKPYVRAEVEGLAEQAAEATRAPRLLTSTGTTGSERE